MHSLLPDSILATIAYSDIFDYALNNKELWRYLIDENSKLETSNLKLQKELEKLVKEKRISKVGEFYCLDGREKIVEVRKKRKEISREALQKAKWISNILSLISSIHFIGVSGSLAMDNMESNGDIDLFIITSPNTVWITRLFTVLILQVLGIRRKRIGFMKKGIVCTNMFVDETAFVFTKSKQNLYTAHEIAQLKPMVSKNNTYTKFIRSNSWIKKYLPNAVKESIVKEQAKSKVKNFFFTLCELSFTLIEPIARYLQFQYMKKHITTETISNTMLAFHPMDYEKIILREYKKRLNKYKVSSIKY